MHDRSIELSADVRRVILGGRLNGERRGCAGAADPRIRSRVQPPLDLGEDRRAGAVPCVAAGGGIAPRLHSETAQQAFGTNIQILYKLFIKRLIGTTFIQVVFFEKNGLKHGEFRLPFGPNDVVVESLAWNRDGDALAVCCREKAGAARKSHLLVYTCSNYHWSLKQAWEYPDAGELFLPPSFVRLQRRKK